MGLPGLSSRRRLNVRRRRHRRLSDELRRQIADSLEVKRVEDLEREHQLPELDLSVRPLEDPGPTGDGQVRVIVRQVRALYGQVAVLAEVEAEDGLVPVPFLLGHVPDEDADAGGDPQAPLQVAGVDLVGEGDQVAERVHWFLTQFQDRRASPVSLVDLVHV
ncbi:hypothetical protein TorRG33x02_171670 [Trema orientale]|uniref:Uncharacterized protein n=1 Tax=Trema orientale TaxID=63057 RepID=A0A2P5ENC6_TREOI|nr:hypothetical protein TorRG33x02_171670 [Trema orientale]